MAVKGNLKSLNGLEDADSGALAEFEVGQLARFSFLKDDLIISINNIILTYWQYFTTIQILHHNRKIK